MITAVFRFLNFETFVTNLAALGVPTHPDVDEDGNNVPIEYRIAQCTTPPLHDIRGNLVCCVLLTEEQAALIPDVTDPDFLCDWRSDEVMDVEEVAEDGSIFVHEQPLPWPTYEIPTYDVEGQLSGTRMQGCGRIA